MSRLRRIIVDNSPAARAAKATAAELQARQDRMRGIETGAHGKDFEERRERLRELRAQEKQAKLDRLEATQKLLGEG